MALSPSDIFIEIYNCIKDLIKSGETPIKSLVVSILVYAVKEFFKENIFNCPLQHYCVYGNLFLFGPAVVLFCISLLVSESLWHLTTGVLCCRRVIWWKSRKSVYVATLPPLIWLILVFADAHYYICAKIGPVKIAKAAVNTTAEKEALDLKISNARTESQIIAWGLLISVVVIATIVLTIDRCISKPGSKLIRKSEFEELEADYAVDEFNKRIKPLAETKAKEVIQDFFEECKDMDPKEIVIYGEKYLAGKFPSNEGVKGLAHCTPATPKENISKIKAGLFASRPKNNEDVGVKLTESGPHQHYTSIN
ncbi:calcium homeostasis modulator protein 6 [Exaiptasia diaphana]|uniref:Uncharacterized protein n=1 Tax=Exaiptasia diaphana TaxID=2652724 RepID=A0A913Y302_EXADI|nr:calcium homeostasis modulator protein 6 [Exaiptasia diaphana]